MKEGESAQANSSTQKYENQIINNTCNDNGLAGIFLVRFCSGNNFVNNTANGNRRSPSATALATAGIALGNPTTPTQLPLQFPRGNKFVANTVLDNVINIPRSWDIVDRTVETPECGNLWRNNVFVKDNETGADAGPGRGCIR